MNLKKILGSLVAVVLEEAGRNPDFKERIEAVLQSVSSRRNQRPNPAPTTRLKASKERAVAVRPPFSILSTSSRRANPSCVHGLRSLI